MSNMHPSEEPLTAYFEPHCRHRTLVDISAASDTHEHAHCNDCGADITGRLRGLPRETSILDLAEIRHRVGVTHSEVSALCSHVDDLLAEVERLNAVIAGGNEMLSNANAQIRELDANQLPDAKWLDQSGYVDRASIVAKLRQPEMLARGLEINVTAGWGYALAVIAAAIERGDFDDLVTRT